MSLDIILREESKGTYGVRNLMLDLSKKYGAKKAFKDDELIAEITQMTYPVVGEFFKNHVEGKTPIDYDALFAKTGIVKKKQTVDTRYFIDNSNQPFVGVNKKREIHFLKKTNTGLAALGVKENDVLKKVNGEDFTLQTANTIIVKTFSWKAGDKISLEVIRDGKTMTLEGNAIVPQAEQIGFVIENLPADNAKTKLRKAWLKG
jgi:predicted metalloprotease with PDZ domain